MRTKARDLTKAELASAPVQTLIDDMIETMHEYDGVGLAAPQVHVSLRLAVLEVPPYDERTEEEIPLLVLVNPKVTPLGDDKVPGLEGCLSIPGLRGSVPRFKKLRLEALDRAGKAYAVEAADFFARVVQHECDHLIGKLYPMRITDFSKFGFTEVLFPGLDAPRDD